MAIITPLKKLFNWQLASEKIQQSSSSQSAYKVYTALLTQSGTDAPVATVLENTLGDIVWTRDSVGIYRGTLNGVLFLLEKTIIPPFSPNGNICMPITGLQDPQYYQIYPSNLDYIGIAVYDDSEQNFIEWSSSNLGGNSLFIEIRLYN